MESNEEKSPKPAEASSGAKPAGGVTAEETLEQAARREVRAMLVKALLETAHRFQKAADELGRR
jgi:ADP-ribose pyrophosphatase YjhB (NUDIX family)